MTKSIAKDIAVLNKMLSDNGRWMIFVHEGHIVKIVKVPEEEDVAKALTTGNNRAIIGARPSKELLGHL